MNFENIKELVGTKLSIKYSFVHMGKQQPLNIGKKLPHKIALVRPRSKKQNTKVLFLVSKNIDINFIIKSYWNDFFELFIMVMKLSQ